MADEESEERIIEVRKEPLSKNPIRVRLDVDLPTLPVDVLTGMVSKGRDFFHSFISQTIRRRYQRPPIYLVDSWVIDALGLFTPNDIVQSASGWSTVLTTSGSVRIGGFEKVVESE